MQAILRNVLSSSTSLFSKNTRCLLENGHLKSGKEHFLPATSILLIHRRTKKTVVMPSSENCVTATSAIYQKGKGKIYDKKPFKFTCIAGKSYLWCSCGWSRTQPFCDSTHKNPHYKITMKPIRFIPRETKEFTFCNCKQTNNRPFCDGTHTKEEIQAAIKS